MRTWTLACFVRPVSRGGLQAATQEQLERPKAGGRRLHFSQSGAAHGTCPTNSARLEAVDRRHLRGSISTSGPAAARTASKRFRNRGRTHPVQLTMTPKAFSFLQGFVPGFSAWPTSICVPRCSLCRSPHAPHQHSSSRAVKRITHPCPTARAPWLLHSCMLDMIKVHLRSSVYHSTILSSCGCTHPSRPATPPAALCTGEASLVSMSSASAHTLTTWFSIFDRLHAFV